MWLIFFLVLTIRKTLFFVYEIITVRVWYLFLTLDPLRINYNKKIEDGETVKYLNLMQFKTNT